MRLPKRGEKGFTLIELLIVVAILGVLAAVVIPNVTRFVGSGETEAAETELHNIQLAVTSMMLENGLTTIPDPVNEVGAIATNQMGWAAADGFPDWGSATADGGLGAKSKDPTGTDYELADQDGYVLFGHDITGGDGATALVNYVVVNTTAYYYTCEGDGTVKQWADSSLTPMP